MGSDSNDSNDGKIPAVRLTRCAEVDGSSSVYHYTPRGGEKDFAAGDCDSSSKSIHSMGRV